MKVVVCGAGQVGSQIARHLAEEGNNVTVIDHNSGLVRRLADMFDISGIVGFASRPDVLKRAGTDDCDMLIAATSMDEVNMVACQVAHSVFEVPTKIARVRTESYLEAEWSDLFRREHLPIDVIISPETEVAQVTHRRLGATAAFDIEPFLEGTIDFVGIRLEDDCPVTNTPLRQLSELFSTLRARVLAVKREGRLFTASPEDQLFPDDEVYFVAAREDVARTFGIFGKQNRVANRVLIIGAGYVGLRLARLIEERQGQRATLIERNRDKAERAVERLRRTVVLNGDALDSGIMEEAGLEDADAIVALTDDDRTNLMSCALAEQTKPLISIALAKDPVFERLADPLDIDALIDPRATTVSSILRHVRRGKIRAVYSVAGGAGEVIEAQVMSTSALAGKRLRDIDLPKGAIVGALRSGGRLVMPTGDTVIGVGDVLVLFAARTAVRQVEQMFRVSIDFF
ncbi:MAG: Trk system potassium transporter TrkA [Pseudomonadota bacterium]